MPQKRYDDMGIVMRSSVGSIISKDIVSWEYFIVENPLKRPRPVSKEAAMAYVEDNGLVEAERNEYGTIWDTPSLDFKNRYKGMGTDPVLSKRLDDIWLR